MFLLGRRFDSVRESLDALFFSRQTEKEKDDAMGSDVVVDIRRQGSASVA